MLLCINACEQQDTTIKNPKSLTIGLLPDQSSQKLLESHKPLFDFIADKLNIKCHLIVPKDYPELVDLFNQEKIDLAFFGGYTFIQANQRNGAAPLVMRNIDKNFVSYLIVRKDSGLKDIQSLKSKRFAFGSELSTSGHLMPRYYMSNLEINPEDFFSTVLYSGAHDNTFQWVLNKKVDAGVMNASIYNQLIQKENSRDNIKILWQSPPYPDYVWAIQPYFSEEFNHRLTDVFLSITAESNVGKTILQNLSAEAFYPATLTDFEELKMAIRLIEPNHE